MCIENTRRHMTGQGEFTTKDGRDAQCHQMFDLYNAASIKHGSPSTVFPHELSAENSHLQCKTTTLINLGIDIRSHNKG